MLPNPATIYKYRYIEKTSTWKVRCLYLFGIFSWLLIMVGYWGLIGVDPFYSWFVLPIFILLSIYHLCSFALNLFYRQFSLVDHFEKVMDYKDQPAVDVFLPICGEELDVLQNTWQHVARLNYTNKTVYVLDDSKEHTEEHKALAEQFGFHYMERPNKGEMKKAGNLKYTFERSHGEFIVILDADFAPHPDFLKETLPYMQDPQVGIVQTPQYFELSDSSYKASPFAYNAAFAEEPFYRFIQVTRSRFGGTICCGSCALYRRSAIEAIGGPYQIDYSEDAHTGYAITRLGYRVLYVPVILSIGLCPDNQYAFFHQQHRWCMGSMRLMLSNFFWKGKTSWQTKFCYVTGFMFYAHHPLIIAFSFHLFWTLFLYNEYIPLGKSLAFYPHLLFAVIYLWIFPLAKLRIGYFGLLMGRTYAYAHAVKTAVFRKSVGWVSTNAKHKTVSAAFSQTTTFVGIYVFCYFLLILLGFRTHTIHLFDHHYWSIQFWLFWNLMLSSILLWQLVATKNRMSNQLVRFNYLPVRHIALFSVAFVAIMGSPTLDALIPTPQAQSQAVTGHEVVQTVTHVEPEIEVTGASASATPAATSSATPRAKRQAVVKKEYGGWYWNKGLGKAQRWMGTDSNGQDIWSD